MIDKDSILILEHIIAVISCHSQQEHIVVIADLAFDHHLILLHHGRLHDLPLGHQWLNGPLLNLHQMPYLS